GITGSDHKISSSISEISALKNTFERQQNSSQSQISDIISDEFLKIEDCNPPEGFIESSKNEPEKLIAKERNALYLVTEWAEFGNLKEYYKKYMLGFDLKLKFALDVTRGLNFLISVKIFHHDIRSENSLITINKCAKIAHFGLSREFTDATRNIVDDIYDIQRIRYMTPEKLLDCEHKYDI
ncbi:9166_t:CDS:2, partial [Gigaspora margarita]